MNGKTEDRSCLIYRRATNGENNKVLFAEYDPETLEAEMFNASGKRLQDIDKISSDTKQSPYVVALCTPEVVEKFKAGIKVPMETDSTGIKIHVAQ